MSFANKLGGALIGTLAVVATAGCVEDDGESLGAGLDEDRTYYYAVTWGCPTCRYKNSPHFGLYPINDFHLGMGASSGYSMGELLDPNGDRHPAGFKDGVLVAHTSKGDKSGLDLVDWALVFEQGGAETRVRIMRYVEHPNWKGKGLIPTYALAAEVGPPGEVEFESVCPGLGYDDTNVVFTPGETYDPVNIEVVAGTHDRVTMACRGHAVAKLKFLGHDPNDDYGSSEDQRQAALKMLTADYCGDGNPNTQVGTPLNFEDSLGLFTPDFFAPFGAIEARWDSEGATCVNEPRLKGFHRGQLPCEAALPKCTGKGLDGAEWVSYVPAP